MKRIYQDAYRVVRQLQGAAFYYDSADDALTAKTMSAVMQKARARYNAFDLLYPDILTAAVNSHLAICPDYAGLTPDTFTMGF